MGKKRTPYSGPCAIQGVLQLFGGKWKPGILYHLLQQERLRFSELQRLIPQVTQRMLTLQLRELEKDGLVTRTEYDEKPPRVEYAPTVLATSLAAVFQTIEDWGKKNMSTVKASRRRFE